MPITLNTETIPGLVKHTGGDTFTIVEGQKLTIKTTSPKLEILDLKVPEGHTWEVRLELFVRETNT